MGKDDTEPQNGEERTTLRRSGRLREKAEIIPYELDAGNTDERTCS